PRSSGLERLCCRSWKKVFDAVFLGAAMQIPSLLQIEAECHHRALGQRICTVSDDTLRASRFRRRAISQLSANTGSGDCLSSESSRKKRSSDQRQELHSTTQHQLLRHQFRAGLDLAAVHSSVQSQPLANRHRSLSDHHHRLSPQTPRGPPNHSPAGADHDPVSGLYRPWSSTTAKSAAMPAENATPFMSSPSTCLLVRRSFAQYQFILPPGVLRPSGNVFRCPP